MPSWEYVPDGEPHVFGDRVYVYGSHDRFNGMAFCMNDYVCWSAPVTDLSEWKYEGVIWRKKNDPVKGRGFLFQMYAPDVVQGLDGRYYLYYFIGTTSTIGVAVCDTPAGEYEYLGRVRYPDGRVLGAEKDLHQFDPAVFRDGDSVYLYTGFAPRFPNPITDFRRGNVNGAMGAELESDMLTVKLPTARIAKTVHNSRGTGFEGHEFFEASSMRKFGDKYYFIYSSVNGHELCYAVGNAPLGSFDYGGTLVSIGDLGLSDKPLNYLGNTHGSIEFINGEYYVFYHRHTNNHCFSRQACAERITRTDDGRFLQAELTSCGLNDKPLAAKGEYGANIACHLFSKKGTRFMLFKRPAGCHPYFTQSGEDRERDPDQYVKNFCDGATAGFKYFDFDGCAHGISVTVRGKAKGKITVRDGLNGNTVAVIEIDNNRGETKSFASKLNIAQGKKPLYFTYNGKGRPDFLSFRLG